MQGTRRTGRHTRRLGAAGAVMVLLALGVAVAPAAAFPTEPCPDTTFQVSTITFTGDGADGSWDDPANWVDTSAVHRVPATGDRVCIDLPGVTLDHSVTIAGLEVQAGGDLTVTGPDADHLAFVDMASAIIEGTVDLRFAGLLGQTLVPGTIRLRDSVWSQGDRVPDPSLFAQGTVQVEHRATLYGQVAIQSPIQVIGPEPATVSVGFGRFSAPPPYPYAIDLDQTTFDPPVSSGPVPLSDLTTNRHTALVVHVATTALGGSRWFDVQGTYQPQYEGGRIEVNPYSQPCTGERWMLMRWKHRTWLPGNEVRPTLAVTQVPEGRSIKLEERGDQFVAVVSGRPSSGEAGCVEPANERFVSGLYIDALGRPVDPSGFAHWTSHADTTAERLATARTIRATLPARRRWVDREYRRVLDRAPDPAGQAYWADRLGGGTDPDLLRAGLYGSNEFRTRFAPTGMDLADQLAQRELGVARDESVRAQVAGLLAAGASRGSAARAVLARPDADRGLVRRELAYWWGREPSEPEVTAVTAQLRGGLGESRLIDQIAAQRLLG